MEGRLARRWSKAKQQLDQLICATLKNRVHFHVTAYRKAHDQMGRAFITVDGKDIFSMCTLAAINKTAEIESRFERVRGVEDVLVNRRIHDEALQEANGDGYFFKYA
ncbi:SF0329 family protein [Bacillus sonorensis]|uniref:SF0329 family protein n=1 Tax=Bacillus sonorensis TaxID=119858 RepID=UPI003B9682FF